MVTQQKVREAHTCMHFVHFFQTVQVSQALVSKVAIGLYCPMCFKLSAPVIASDGPTMEATPFVLNLIVAQSRLICFVIRYCPASCQNFLLQILVKLMASPCNALPRRATVNSGTSLAIKAT